MKEGDHELPSPGDQEGWLISPAKGYAMPGHPPSPVGKGHAAASNAGNSGSLEAEAGGKPIPGHHRDTRGMPQCQARRSSHALAQVWELATAGGATSVF